MHFILLLRFQIAEEFRRSALKTAEQHASLAKVLETATTQLQEVVDGQRAREVSQLNDLQTQSLQQLQSISKQLTSLCKV